MIFWQPDNGTLHQGHVLEVLKSMEAESVQCVVTSPPYWGLRDYKLPPMVWDGVDGCEHEWGEEIPGSNRGGSGTPTDKNNRGESYGRDSGRGGFCSLCGAWRGSLGLEPTPELFVQHIVQVFREVRRVLKPDGVLFINLGDSYNAHPGQRTVHDKAGTKQQTVRGSCEAASRNTPSLKPKDLVGIPWRVAFALQADGWYLRSDIIWHKPNPMPESVTDRPTKAHEYIFLLTKSAKYYWDANSVREPHMEVSLARAKRNRFGGKYQGADSAEHGALKKGNGYGPGGNPDVVCSPGGRNIRSVWTISTKPFSEAHFATFPPEIPEKCIKAGSRRGDVILDPFFGAGTVGLEAERLGRKWVGIELNADYCQMARDRIEPHTRQMRFPL